MKFYTQFILVVYLSLLVVVTPDSAFSQCDEHNYFWVSGAGYWSNPENWLHQEWDPDLEDCVDLPGVPSCDDWPYLNNTETISITDFACGQTAGFGPGGAVVSGTGTLTIINEITVELGASFLQTGGEVSAERLEVGGTYELQNGELTIINDITVESESGTLFLQTGGDVNAERLEVGQQSDSNGTYKLQNGLLLLSNFTHIGDEGTGDFNQSGGTFSVGTYLILGQWPGSEGTYVLSNQGRLLANKLFVGYQGAGMFTQTSGTVDVNDDFKVAYEPNSNGTYDLLSGTLNVKGYAEVGRAGRGIFRLADSNSMLNLGGDLDIGRKDGSGSFEINGGTINGTTDDAGIYVYPTATLIGSGTFNISVEYRSEQIYGKDHGDNVSVVFEPNCLTEAGLCSIEQTNLDNFAGGNVTNILPSSVFNVNFSGEFCGEFIIAIPYDEAELTALGGDETGLVILQETDPNTYKVLTNSDLWEDEDGTGIYAIATEFGKFAVAVNNGDGAVVIPREWWADIPGTAVSDLTSNANYPDKPSGRDFITSLEGPINWADNYGTRIRGYLHPPADSNYTFWIASDANSELWLSTDAHAANKVLIAHVSGETNSREWTKYPEQQSLPIPLAKDRKYYIEVLHKAGYGNDNIAVAWGPPSGQEVIPAIYLFTYCYDFMDFSHFASKWQLTGCNADNSWCSGADFNLDGSVLLDDLELFAESWLAGIE